MTNRRTGRQQAVLDAAARLFAERGFHGVSIDDLGAELGVSGPALYRYFQNKESILAEMLIAISERLLDGARACIAGGQSAECALTDLIGFHVDFALSEPDLIAVQFRDLDNVPEPSRRKVRRLQREYVNLWVDTLQQIHPGTERQRIAASAQAVFGLLNSTPHSRRLSREEMGNLLSTMAWTALTVGCTVNVR